MPVEKELLEKLNKEHACEEDDVEEIQCNNDSTRPHGPAPALDNMELPAMFWDEMPENAGW